jgi:hypothetical protein
MQISVAITIADSRDGEPQVNVGRVETVIPTIDDVDAQGAQLIAAIDRLVAEVRAASLEQAEDFVAYAQHLEGSGA